METEKGASVDSHKVYICDDVAVSTIRNFHSKGERMNKKANQSFERMHKLIAEMKAIIRRMDEI